jgi:hypothetical protein
MDWDVHVETHEPWNGVYASDCVYCAAARRRAVIRDVLRDLRQLRGGVVDFSDEEVTQPDAELPLRQLVNS